MPGVWLETKCDISYFVVENILYCATLKNKYFFNFTGEFEVIGIVLVEHRVNY